MNSAAAFRRSIGTFAIAAAALVALLPTGAEATVYKCETSNGGVTFQQRPCAASQSEQIVEMRHASAPENTGPTAEEQYAQLRESQYAESHARADQARVTPEERRAKEAEDRRKQCQRARKAQREHERRVVAECKKRRETYCDQSADRITALTDSRWYRTASHQQQHNYDRANQGSRGKSWAQIIRETCS